jgi:hypothetical protein
LRTGKAIVGGTSAREKVKLNLTAVDELIEVRKNLQGGRRGAPRRRKDGARQGDSLNRSCVVLLSALLQSYVQEVFEKAAKEALPNLRNDQVWDTYWKQMKSWGNPSADNIKSLFLRIGIDDVLDGLSWQNCDNESVRCRLTELNQVRNSIAHGADRLKVNGKKYTLTLAKVETFRDFAKVFADHFEKHALDKLQGRQRKLQGRQRKPQGRQRKPKGRQPSISQRLKGL